MDYGLVPSVGSTSYEELIIPIWLNQAPYLRVNGSVVASGIGKGSRDAKLYQLFGFSSPSLGSNTISFFVNREI